MRFIGLAASVVVAAAPLAAQSHTADDAPIVVTDIENFWRAYDLLPQARSENDTLWTFFEHYYIPGSPGLRDFIRARIGSVVQLVDEIRRRPQYYASIRESTLRVRTFEPALRAMLQKWDDLVGGTSFPEIYFLIGRLTSGGTTSHARILIGTEMYGRTPGMPEEELRGWLLDVLRPVERLPDIVAHELIHTQQQPRDDNRLLARALHEGIADFLGEMLSGDNINAHVHEWADPREAELWADFQKVMLQRGAAGWLYASRRDGEPNDLGYWMGYKIGQAYYRRADDKRQAIRDMLTIDDAEAFLEASGYGQ